MPAKTSAPIRQALVQAVRALPAYSSLNGIFPAFAPEETQYPFATYNQVAAPYDDDWSNRLIVAVFDVSVFSKNQVQASDLDQAIADGLDGSSLAVDGMNTLICQRVADIVMPPDADEEGKKVFQIGGTYEVWADQPR